MNIHCLQHIRHEGLGTIEAWITKHNHRLVRTFLYENHILPNVNDVDWLFIMGGPMSVNDELELPWLVAEKQFVKKCIDSGKTVVGFCLGAQLIANVLGAKVYKNKYKEIGWSKVLLTDSGLSSLAFTYLPATVNVFQWHGETFDLPANATLLASNDVCKNQAFMYNDRVIGLQFHLEVTLTDVTSWIEQGFDELKTAPYVQTIQQMTSDLGGFLAMEKYLHTMLDNLQQ